jgi:hypothetical protein
MWVVAHKRGEGGVGGETLVRLRSKYTIGWTPKTDYTVWGRHSRSEIHDAGDYIVSLISEEAGWTTPGTEQKRTNGQPNLFSGSANVCTRTRVAVCREAREWAGREAGRQAGN